LINLGSDPVVISAGTVAARIAYRVDKLRGQLARIEPDRIVYTEHLMRKEGYAPRQIWTPGEAELQVVPGGNV
jgi:hypothetical protein